MRKLFIFLLSINLSTLSISQIVACSNPFYGANVLRLTIVTDGHTINDHSFNEATYDGAIQFQNQFNQWSNNLRPDKFVNKQIKISIDQPETTDLYTLLQGYQNAYVMNSFATIASGFIHYDALVQAQNHDLKNKMHFIYVDGDTPNSAVPAANKNLDGLLFEAEQSGFLAGIAGFCWLTAHNEQYGGLNNLKVSTYGGLDISTVTNYMYGFYWALQLWDYLATSINISKQWSDLKNFLIGLVNTLNPKIGSNFDFPNIKFISLPSQFTGDFDQSSAGSQALNGALVAAGAQVIFPVSGPQVADTLAAEQAAGNNGMVIGVDTDEQKEFPSQANRFITSALKNIQNAVSKALWHSLDLADTKPHQQKQYNFSNDASPKGWEDGYTGIADNAAISPIYQDIMSSSIITTLLDSVSVGWQKVLAKGNNFWKNSQDSSSNPFVFN